MGVGEVFAPRPLRSSLFYFRWCPARWWLSLQAAPMSKGDGLKESAWDAHIATTVWCRVVAAGYEHGLSSHD